jgi:hypothetical protein
MEALFKTLETLTANDKEKLLAKLLENKKAEETHTLLSDLHKKINQKNLDPESIAQAWCPLKERGEEGFVFIMDGTPRLVLLLKEELSPNITNTQDWVWGFQGFDDYLAAKCNISIRSHPFLGLEIVREKFSYSFAAKQFPPNSDFWDEIDAQLRNHN